MSSQIGGAYPTLIQTELNVILQDWRWTCPDQPPSPPLHAHRLLPILPHASKALLSIWAPGNSGVFMSLLLAAQSESIFQA